MQLCSSIWVRSILKFILYSHIPNPHHLSTLQYNLDD